MHNNGRTPFHHDQQPSQIPGTQSKVSNKKQNNALVHQIWQYDHDPNDSFLNNMINDKLRKHHSSQQNLHRYFVDDVNKGKGQQYEYYSMVDQSGVANNVFVNQYGLANRPNQQHNSNDKNTANRQFRTGKPGHHNQLQRAIINIQDNTQSYCPKPHNILQPPYNRQQDILQHKRISNINYIMRQIRQIISLTRMQAIQAEIQESRSGIIRLEIHLRRLRISLRNTSGSGSRVSKNNKKVEEGGVTSVAAMQEYGYVRKESKSPQQYSQNLCSLAKKSVKNLQLLRPSPRSMASNLIKIQSNIKNRQNIETVLTSQIQKQRITLQQLIQRQKQLNTQLHNLHPSSLSNKKLHQPSPKKQLLHPHNHHQSLHYQHHNNKNSPYHTLLCQKHTIIGQTLQKFKHHYKYKENKLQEQNSILKEQLKIVENKIYDIGISLGMMEVRSWGRDRGKNSIGGGKNGGVSNQQGWEKGKIGVNQGQEIGQVHRIQGIVRSKSRRKLLLRSPIHRPETTHTIPQPQPYTYIQNNRNLGLRKVCSQQVLSTSHPDSNENIETPYTGRQQQTNQKNRGVNKDEYRTRNG